MGRPKKIRCCRRYRADRIYKPQGIQLRDLDTTVLSLDQFEVLRLCDVKNLDQEAAGKQMGISRGTVQRLLYSARRSLVSALIDNRALIINLKESEACDVDVHSDQRRCRSRRHGK